MYICAVLKKNTLVCCFVWCNGKAHCFMRVKYLPNKLSLQNWATYLCCCLHFLVCAQSLQLNGQCYRLESELLPLYRKEETQIRTKNPIQVNYRYSDNYANEQRERCCLPSRIHVFRRIVIFKPSPCLQHMQHSICIALERLFSLFLIKDANQFDEAGTPSAPIFFP